LKLTNDTRARLAKLIRLLGSDNAGEVAAAAHKLQEVLRSSGADLHDLAALLEEERVAAPGAAGHQETSQGRPRPPPASRRPPRRSQHRAKRGTGKLTMAAASILAIGVLVGAALAVRGLSDARPRQTVATAAMPTEPPLVVQSPSVRPVIPRQPEQVAPSPEQLARQPDAVTAQPEQVAPPIEAPPPQAAPAPAPMREAALPRPKPVAAKPEPAAETHDARNAARSAVGELIRQIRFPQRIDPVTSMVSISAYGSEIVASYRAAVADETINTDALRRLTLERTCDLPIMMSALNRGATHRARYTDLNGHVAEVVISAKDCQP
jgi:hypothetical protein